MNEQQPPPEPQDEQSAPYHPAPRQGWVPMSALAVTAFVLSIVFMFVAFYGLWIVELVPLAMGVFTLLTVKPGQKRGRILAIWAIVIAIGAGSCTYFMHANMRAVVGEMGETILAALSAKGATPEDREKALKPWLFEEALEKNPDLVATLHERFLKVEAELGPYKNELDLGSPYRGSMTYMMQPDLDGEIGSEDTPPGMLTALWITAKFEKGNAVMSLTIRRGGRDDVWALGELQAKAAPIIGDIRFYRPKNEP